MAYTFTRRKPEDKKPTFVGFFKESKKNIVDKQILVVPPKPIKKGSQAMKKAKPAPTPAPKKKKY